MGQLLILVGVLGPLAVDTFGVSAAISIVGLKRRERPRISLGLLRISLLIAVVWIALQALIAAQVGMRLGSRVGEALRERAEHLAGVVLIGMAGVLLVLKWTSRL